MTTQYSRSVLRMVVAQICQTIGWHSINSTPLEFMVDLMQEYIFELSKLTQQYAQVLGRCDANLDDLGLAFRHMNIDLQELAEYVRNVDSVPCVVSVPKLPVHKESHLNFLKPGSREVVTRPVHVHEHLPAMYPNTEDIYPPDTAPPESNSVTNETVNTSEDESNENNNIVATNGISLNEDSPVKTIPSGVFKRPGDPISLDGPVVKRAKTTEEGRPLREIHSVIMTTSGFLSTAREGKLPEARTPQQARAETPPPEAYPMVPPEVKVEKKLKKIPKKEDGKPENKENKKKKIPKDNLFQPDEIKDVKVKKLAGMKELAKLKALKPGSKASSPNLAGPSNVNNVKTQGKVSGGSPKPVKSGTPPTKAKAEKSDVEQNTESPFSNERKEETIDKLPIEPDKQKLNIFKKISNSKPKEDKEKESDSQHKLKEMASRENSPALIAGDNLLHRNDIIKPEDKKPIAHIHPLVNNNNAMRMSNDVMDLMNPSSTTYTFDMSPPTTPGAPKTPEVRAEVPNFVVEKKKRKDKTAKKKEPKPKIPKNSLSPKKARLSSDSLNEVISLDRPKTPTIEKDIQSQPIQLPPTRDSIIPPHIPYPMFPAPFQSGPGLIPHPMFPMPMHKNMPRIPNIVGVPNSPAAIPGIMHPRFRPPLDGGRPPFIPPSFVNEPMSMVPSFPLKQPQLVQQPTEKQRTKSPDKEFPTPKPTLSTYPMPEAAAPPLMLNTTGGIPPPLMPTTISPVVPAPLLPPNISLTKPVKPEKDKSEKKSKEHKKEKKEKMKKKKEKKEKHKDRGEKIKEKKDKSEKKDKLEKIKEKKEKKEKRKEKEASKKLAKEEKVVESVPKITLKLGLAGDSPRPSTPDSALTKKITIKPPKKPEEEVKREPTPELARISALVTRPPKQKSTSKKAEECLLEAYGNLSSEASFSCSTLTSNSRGKKPVFKALPQQQPSPSSYLNSHASLETQQGTQYCFTDPSGRTVWICPACGKEDDGSPMIGCDNCDAWYHWVCVGIQVAPADNVDWYCRLCIAKKQELHHDKKKKKRKKKVKVNA